MHANRLKICKQREQEEKLICVNDKIIQSDNDSSSNAEQVIERDIFNSISETLVDTKASTSSESSDSSSKSVDNAVSENNDQDNIEEAEEINEENAEIILLSEDDIVLPIDEHHTEQRSSTSASVGFKKTHLRIYV